MMKSGGIFKHKSIELIYHEAELGRERIVSITTVRAEATAEPVESRVSAIYLPHVRSIDELKRELTARGLAFAEVG